MDPKAASRYAKACFLLAESRGELKKVEGDFSQLIKLVKQYPEISHLVSNSTISLPEKEDFLEKIFPDDMARLLIHFLKVLVKKRRFGELLNIQAIFHSLYEKKQGIQEVKAVTAVPLSSSNQDKLRRVLEKNLRKDIRLVPEVEPGLLGGLILRFDGTEIDASFKSRLTAVRQRLMRSKI